METLLGILSSAWFIFLVAIGLGFVIFVHELGHFIVAKWAGVYVERFSIGFGKILVSYKNPNKEDATEYALSLLPLGGYVKMLGENPEENTDDPRAYNKKPVPRRMAIISAGVIMNVIFGFLFFIVAFNLGLPYIPPIVGWVAPGMPAWEAGIRMGDRILDINDDDIIDFENVMEAVGLSDGPLDFKVFRKSREYFLFEEKADFAGALDARVLPDQLRDTFAGHNVLIDPDTRPVIRERGSLWTIEGDASGDIGTYVLSLRDGVLTAYTALHLDMTAEHKELQPKVGIGVQDDLRLFSVPTAPGTECDKLNKRDKELFQGDDLVVKLDSQEVHTATQYEEYMARNASRPIQITLSRADKAGNTTEHSVTVPPQQFRSLGIKFGAPEIVSIQRGAAALQAVELDGTFNPLRPGDQIKSVHAGKVSPADINSEEQVDPLMFPSIVAELAAQGAPITLVVLRNSQGPENLHLVVKPSPIPSWLEPPLLPGTLFSVPSLGIAYKVFPSVVEDPPEGSPAYGKLKWKDKITKVRVAQAVKQEGGQKTWSDEILLDDEHPNLPYLFWFLQSYPDSEVELTYKRDNKEGEKVQIKPVLVDGQYVPYRGLRFMPLVRQMPPQGLSRSIYLGYMTTKSTMIKICLTLKQLLASKISPKLLQGPIGIATLAYDAAHRGPAYFLKILALLSINLAIVNFLPIPILDGGHMLFLIWEWLRGKPASERVMIAANYCGLFLIFALLLWVTTQDFLRLW